MKILITTSTLPASDDDKVPAFVKDQAIHMLNMYPNDEIIIQAPHNHYSRTNTRKKQNTSYKEIRFHYFWPFRFELLAGRSILPALKQNKLLYLQIPFLFFFQTISLLRITKKEEPDFIYAHWFTPQAFTATIVSKITHVPLVFTTHASDATVWHKVPFGGKVVKWVCNHARAYTAVSQTTADKLMTFFTEKEWKKVYSKKLSIIPMGVDMNIPKLSKTTIESIRKKYSLPKNKEYILFLGRLAEKKGVTYLLDAYASLDHAHIKNTHIIIAGDGQLLNSLQEKAKKLNINNITFTGYISGTTKDAIFALADYVCLPSIIDSSGDSEGLPVVLMEALAASKIVLASDASSGELIISQSKNGFIFKQKSTESLRDSITKVLCLSQKNKNKIQLNSRQLSREFSWDKITARHYKKLFELK